jgi:hypothetical protein
VSEQGRGTTVTIALPGKVVVPEGMV